ncbi:MAG: bifunctional nuclease domain-containing protein [Propionicimonas sp.]
MPELTVIEIRVSTGDAPPLVVLAEIGGRERRLPIWMSHGGASAIFSATEDPDVERPSIHDLAWRLAESSSDPLDAVAITRFDDGQFYAQLVFAETVLPARPSDAIAIALRAGCPIRCAEAVLDEAGVSAAELAAGVVEPERAPDDEVERFREFLESITPEDFSGDENQP